jgi:hypothetical protein
VARTSSAAATAAAKLHKRLATQHDDVDGTGKGTTRELEFVDGPRAGKRMKVSKLDPPDEITLPNWEAGGYSVYRRDKGKLFHVEERPTGSLERPPKSVHIPAPGVLPSGVAPCHDDCQCRTLFPATGSRPK